MFDTLFSDPAVLRRRQQGPLAVQRADYLKDLAAQGAAHGTLLLHARFLLCIAREMERQPGGHRFDPDEIEAMALEWANGRTALGRVQGPRWPRERFGAIATDFLRFIGGSASLPSARVATTSSLAVAGYNYGVNWVIITDGSFTR